MNRAANQLKKKYFLVLSDTLNFKAMRFYLVLAIMFFGGLTQAQFSAQKVLIEVGTGTWCQACPIAVTMIEMMHEDGFEIAVVKYHNEDPYENEASIFRNNYYDISAFPTIFVDGVRLSAFNNYTQLEALYHTAAGTDRGYNIILTGDWSKEETVKVRTVITKNSDISSANHRFFLAVTESKIPDEWHGQTEVNYAERLLLPANEGMEMQFGDENKMVHHFSFAIDNDWNKDHLAFVGFIQNTETKSVQQSVFFTSAQVAIEEVSEIPDVTIFPNPANDFITLQSGAKNITDLSLTNSMGQEMLHISYPERRVNVSHLNAGLYILKGTIGDKLFTKKIILKK